MDLRDALWGRTYRAPNQSDGWIGVRRLRSLIDGLPPDSTYARSVDPEAYAFMFSAPYTLALSAEVQDSHRLDYIQAKSEKGAFQRPEPLKIPRPGEYVEPEVKTGQDLFAFIQQVGNA